jgi:hypothetical protein
MQGGHRANQYIWVRSSCSPLLFGVTCHNESPCLPRLEPQVQTRSTMQRWQLCSTARAVKYLASLWGSARHLVLQPAQYSLKRRTALCCVHSSTCEASRSQVHTKNVVKFDTTARAAHHMPERAEHHTQPTPATHRCCCRATKTNLHSYQGPVRWLTPGSRAECMSWFRMLAKPSPLQQTAPCGLT